MIDPAKLKPGDQLVISPGALMDRRCEFLGFSASAGTIHVRMIGWPGTPELYLPRDLLQHPSQPKATPAATT